MEHRVPLIYRRFISHQIKNYGVRLLGGLAKCSLKSLDFFKFFGKGRDLILIKGDRYYHIKLY